ncbi:MAG: hypothetical protein NVSMB22_19560 [Chloroflexota bacterium]
MSDLAQKDGSARVRHVERLQGAVRSQKYDMQSHPIPVHRDADSGVYLVDVPELAAGVTEGAMEAAHDLWPLPPTVGWSPHGDLTE